MNFASKSFKLLTHMLKFSSSAPPKLSKLFLKLIGNFHKKLPFIRTKTWKFSEANIKWKTKSTKQEIFENQIKHNNQIQQYIFEWKWKKKMKNRKLFGTVKSVSLWIGNRWSGWVWNGQIFILLFCIIYWSHPEQHFSIYFMGMEKEKFWQQIIFLHLHGTLAWKLQQKLERRKAKENLILTEGVLWISNLIFLISLHPSRRYFLATLQGKNHKFFRSAVHEIFLSFFYSIHVVFFCINYMKNYVVIIIRNLNKLSKVKVHKLWTTWIITTGSFHNWRVNPSKFLHFIL